jgi:hypothetical protein
LLCPYADEEQGRQSYADEEQDSAAGGWAVVRQVAGAAGRQPAGSTSYADEEQDRSDFSFSGFLLSGGVAAGGLSLCVMRCVRLR